MTEINTAAATTNVKPAKTRVHYGFKLDFPDVFTLKRLRAVRKDIRLSYITVRKRIEVAMIAGEIIEAGLYRSVNQKGRMQKVYVKTSVENVQVAIDNEFKAGEIVAL